MKRNRMPSTIALYFTAPGERPSSIAASRSIGYEQGQCNKAGGEAESMSDTVCQRFGDVWISVSLIEGHELVRKCKSRQMRMAHQL